MLHSSRILYVFSANVVIVVGLLAYHLLLPARTFPTGHLIEIPQDAHVGEMGILLEERGVIRSSLVFKVYTRLTRQDRALASGPYVFEKPLGVIKIVYRISHGQHGITPARVTLTEGMTAKDMGRTLMLALPDFDQAGFMELASTSEGYLFPDTYFFTPGTKPEEIMRRLRNRFDEQIATLAPELEATDRSVEDIVIMASLLEREAQSEEDMRMVAGILWKRLDEGMRLQVDAVFGYIRGENGYEPTAKDLELDNPYNTYRYAGLPPTPISNPGLVALRAAATPIDSPYFYYLTGRDGRMYYGKTFTEHVRNRELYLD